MATGILSVGVSTHGLDVLSAVLLWLALAGYAVLVVLNIWRIVAFRAELKAEFTDPRRGFGFFTFVAATNVLGTRLVAADHLDIALALLVVGAAAWIVLGYVVPWTALLGRAERPIVASANGTWFVWVVASQSVAVLSSALQPVVGYGSDGLAVLAVGAWSVGVFLYAAVGVFVAARLLSYPLRPVDLAPPYWVAMGATAITVLAGARIVQMVDTPMVLATRELIAGVSVVVWAFGTWLIPPLIAAGWWRHVTHRFPLPYEATLWSVVFPLGMYGLAGHYLGVADDLPIVRAIGEAEIWVALAAWTATFLAMLVHLAKTLGRPPAPTE